MAAIHERHRRVTQVQAITDDAILAQRLMDYADQVGGIHMAGAAFGMQIEFGVSFSQDEAEEFIKQIITAGLMVQEGGLVKTVPTTPEGEE